MWQRSDCELQKAMAKGNPQSKGKKGKGFGTQWPNWSAMKRMDARVAKPSDNND